MNDIKLALFDKVERCFLQAEDYFDCTIVRPKIAFDIRGQDAGRAYFSVGRLTKRKTQLKFNEILLHENEDSFLENVVAHECAHLVAYDIYGSRIKPHGKEWKSIMCNLYGLEPAVRHHLDVSGVSNKPFVYRCACIDKEIRIGKRQHSNIQKSDRYICNECKKGLVFVREKEDERLDISEHKQKLELASLFIYAQQNIRDDDIPERINYILNRRKPRIIYLSKHAECNEAISKWIKKGRLKSRVVEGFELETLIEDCGEAGPIVTEHVVAIVKDVSPEEKQLFNMLQNRGTKVRTLKQCA